jgi:hypothetical protein
MPPNSPQPHVVQRLAKVGSDSDGETDAFETVQTENSYSLKDARDWVARSVQGRFAIASTSLENEGSEEMRSPS